MTTDGIGGYPNIDYLVDSGVNVNIDFPTCGYKSGSVEEDLLEEIDEYLLNSNVY